jgi:hypothetical protein
MLRLISLVLLVTSCATTSSNTAEDHERRARSYDATADSIENECWKSRRNELTVDAHGPTCWKAEDIRFLEANRNAAARERAEAARLEQLSASR